MNFFSLTKKEYKNYKNEFNKTYIGKKLYGFTHTIIFFFVLYAIFDILIFGIGLADSNYETEYLLTDNVIFQFCIVYLLSFSIYLKYFKEYIEKLK